MVIVTIIFSVSNLDKRYPPVGRQYVEPPVNELISKHADPMLYTC